LDQENTTGISWNKHDLRVAVLEVLRSGSATNHRVGLSKKVIMDCLGVESNLQIDAELEYLHKMKFVKMEDDSYYVTEAGLDYLDNNVTKTR
jgi:hypothetical protein